MSRGLDRRGLDRRAMAERVARDIPRAAYVNLGIGLPTSVAEFLPADRDVTLHTENGMLGMGPAALPGQVDPDLLNAGKIPVTETPGASYFHHADSFAMMRGGHLDLCVLGAFQVSVGGDLANWDTGEPGAIPAVGGAMDLAIGARRVAVLMELFARDGSCKLVEECSYPLTGVHCVDVVYTDLAVFELGGTRPLVRELFGGVDLAELEERTGLALDAGAGGGGPSRIEVLP
jgi:3-oxoadipate CoA-transferase beta subunit